MPRDSAPPRFDIAAAVVFRLGEELITDDVQALVELVKNSYDADATWVNVTIDSKSNNDSATQFDNALGSIVVEDNGRGMGEDAIRSGWLTIASSPKQAQKTKGETTARGRTPIGDKGLGRLGCQRLAENVEIFTRGEKELGKEHHIAFSWGDFHKKAKLSDVPIKWKSRTNVRKRAGTRLVLSGIREPDVWQVDEKLDELQRKLSVMISPFEEAEDFNLYLTVDGKSIELAEIHNRLRESAQLQYKLKFDGETLNIQGRARMNYLKPSRKQDQKILDAATKRDNGESLFEFLDGRKTKGRPLRFRRARAKGWFVFFSTDRSLDDLDNVRRVRRSPVNPGSFRGEIDAVSLESSDAKNTGIGKLSEYRQLVRDLAGIRVYRDGFGIRVDDDWLELGRQWTGGGSYYGLRPGNVLGFIAIDAENNANLVETTSREGFQQNAHYENFYRLLTEFVRFSADSQEFLRRGVIDFVKEHQDQRAGVAPDEEYANITRRIGKVAKQLTSKKRQIEKHVENLERATNVASQTLQRVRGSIESASVKDDELLRTIKKIESDIARVRREDDKVWSQVNQALAHAAELNTVQEVLDRRWETLDEHVSALYESVSLGLTAEVLSHEINNIADRLAKRSADVARMLKVRMNKPVIVTYVEEVRSCVRAMRKQLSHLTPSLKFVRERRDEIDVNAFVKELTRFYRTKLAANKIRIRRTADAANFHVKMNKGKLTQVFDNLILNSEYWLKQAIGAGSIESGQISIEVDSSKVRIFDNARGIEESVEDILFEPFVTMKRKGEGRGLGLYVCRQLLETESCAIELLSDRNIHDRKHIFEIDFSGAIAS